eukprot:s563_g15.t1
MVLIQLVSRAGSIQLLESASLLKGTGRGPGVANLCIVSPADGVSFSVNENADPDVRTDHLAAIPRLHPPGVGQSLLFRKSLTLPCSSGNFSMGTWQGIYLIDLRSRGCTDPVEIEVTFRPSARREEFSVMAAARNATQLETEIAKRLPAEAGAVLVHEKHTSASLSIGSGNVEPVMNQVIPEKWHYEFFQHTLEGPDDMTGHLKCSLLGCSAMVPVQRPMAPVRLNEHRDAGGYGVGHQRRISLDHVTPGGESFELEVSGTTEIGNELTKRGGELVSVLALDGRGGLLMGSRDAVESFQGLVPLHDDSLVGERDIVVGADAFRQCSKQPRPCGNVPSALPAAFALRVVSGVSSAMVSRNSSRNTAQDQHFLLALRATASAISCAGVATLQARQLLITQTASPLGEAAVVQATTAVVQATSGLATAYSLGSVAEFFLSPVFGKMSDRFGRKPILLFFMIGPAIMRTLCALVEQPVARIRLLWLDFASARAVGIQPFLGMCGTMITDVFTVDQQPAARAQLAASQALGGILGNYLSGWWSLQAGPRSTYLCTAAAPLFSLAFAAACLPETNAEIKDGRPSRDVQGSCSVTTDGKTRSAYRTLLRDPESLLIGGALGLYEFLNYAPLNSVAILFMKERLNWGPLEAGRFASGHALAGFCASMLAKTLMQFFGKRLYVSITNLLTSVAYATWAVSKTGPSLIACLLPLSFSGTGGATVLVTRYMERAMQLGLSPGEAMGVRSAIGAVARMIAPQLFTRLWLRAAAQKGQPRALPLGAPMLSVALIAIIQDLLHQSSFLVRQN